MAEPTFPCMVYLQKVADLGTIDNHQITIGYYVRGWRFDPIEVGVPLVILRTNSCGRERLGIFHTSPVKSVVVCDDEPLMRLIRTANSTYRLTYMPEVVWEPEAPLDSST